MRQSGIASALLDKALVQAKNAGCKTAYLFTQTAAEFFANRGFKIILHADVPPALLNSPAVTSCCRASAVAMRLELESLDAAESISSASPEFQKQSFSCSGCACSSGEAQSGGELWRAIGSGVALGAGFFLEQLTGPKSLYLALYVVAILLGGWGNLHKAGRALPRGNFNMSVLMSIAVIGALAIGKYEEAASVAFLFAVSEMLEAWTMDKARRSIQALMAMAPAVARIRRGGEEINVHVEEIVTGDVMIVRPGDQIAMDGLVLSGKSRVNQASITGESLTVVKSVGDAVYAGTLNGPGALEVTVTRLVQDTTLARIIRMVEEAQAQRAPSQAFVEKFAAVYTPLVLVLAALVVIFPPLVLGHEWSPWIYRGLALLVVACPCALVVSTPVAIVSAIAKAARHGVLIKGGIYLEAAGSLQAIAFDKTGTLTRGEPVVTDIVAVADWQETDLLSRTAGLEARSEHPLAAAIVKEAELKGCNLAPAEEFTAIVGRGAQATVGAELLYVGNERLFNELGVNILPVAAIIDRLQREGKIAVLIGTSEEIKGIIAVADTVRPDSADTLKSLKNAGIQHTIMLTGDHKATAQAIAAQVGVDEFRSELLPEDKLTAIEELLAQYGQVAMVGDGINDAPALALSTVGIAMGGAATDTALETADIVLMDDDIGKLPFTIELSRQALQIIRQNISFSIGIKIVAVLAVFPGWLTLWLAILADMGATILVTINSLRLLGAERSNN
jgi:Cd2+/Zn2+-exporting ATPase